MNSLAPEGLAPEGLAPRADVFHTIVV